MTKDLKSPENDEYLYLREKVWVQMELEYNQQFELQQENSIKPAKIIVKYDKSKVKSESVN